MGKQRGTPRLRRAGLRGAPSRRALFRPRARAASPVPGSVRYGSGQRAERQGGLNVGPGARAVPSRVETKGKRGVERSGWNTNKTKNPEPSHGSRSLSTPNGAANKTVFKARTTLQGVAVCRGRKGGSSWAVSFFPNEEVPGGLFFSPLVPGESPL